MLKIFTFFNVLLFSSQSFACTDPIEFLQNIETPIVVIDDINDEYYDLYTKFNDLSPSPINPPVKIIKVLLDKTDIIFVDRTDCITGVLYEIENLK